ncbi:MAG: hypothetical protein ACRD82_19110 [Blastocatellia bacterium]
MNDERTKDLTTDEKLDMILAELSFVKSELAFVKTDFGARLARLEAFAEDRSRDTRPMLNKIHKEVADVMAEVVEVRSELRRLDRKWEVLTDDVMEVRVFGRDLNRRLDKIESQAA